MKENKYIVYDAYIAAFRNCIAYIRPLFLTLLIAIPLFIFAVGILYLFNKGLVDKVLPMLFYGAPAGLNLYSHSQFVIMGITAGVFIFLFLSFLIASYCNYGLRFHKGNDSQKVAFPPFKAIIKIFFAKLIQLIVFLPLMLCFVFPGMYWLLRTQFIEFAILDKNAGVFSAFSQSLALTKDKAWTMFAFFVVSLTVASIFPGAMLFLAPIPLVALGHMYKEIGK